MGSESTLTSLWREDERRIRMGGQHTGLCIWNGQTPACPCWSYREPHSLNPRRLVNEEATDCMMDPLGSPRGGLLLVAMGRIVSST